MRFYLFNAKWIAPIMAAGVMVVSGCTDDKYDLNEVDMTVGIGGGELTLPGSSTTNILLDDVLDIDNSECVVIEEDGDYVFRQVGADVEPVKVRIERIVITENTSNSLDVSFTTPDLSGLPNAQGEITLPAEIKADGEVHVFDYSDDSAPEELVELRGATVSEHFDMKVKFSADLKKYVPTLKELKLRMPAYMVLENVNSSASFTQDGAMLTFKNVSTGNDLTITGNVTRLDFTNSDKTLGKLEMKKENGKTIVSLDGKVNVSASFDKMILDGSSLSNAKLSIGSDVVMSKFEVTSAEGRFDPTIDLNDLGDADITGVPSFLEDDGVVIDLYNPQILLTLDGNLDVAGTVTGRLTSYKAGRTLKTLDIPEMKINAGSKTRICICRVNSTDVQAKNYDQVVVVPDLSELIKTIPDKVTFSAQAKADKNKVVNFMLGHDYTITPSYAIEAPLAFADDACIVYTDSIDDLSSDLEDIDLGNDAQLVITADVENHVPAYIEVSATALDINGNELAPTEVKVDVEGVVAAYNGDQTASSPLKITARQQTKGALKKLDKIKFTIEAKAKADGCPAVTGQTLNAKKHYIKADNISVKLVGKVTADLN